MAIEIKNLKGEVIFTLCENNLIGADLVRADLVRADLRGANLIGADMRGADLRYANLSGSYLIGSDLSGAKLIGAELSGADVSLVNMSGAKLNHADVLNINASDATNDYDIFATSTHLKIGCHCHSWDDWMGFDDFSIMTDGEWDNKFWILWKPILQAIATDRGWI